MSEPEGGAGMLRPFSAMAKFLARPESAKMQTHGRHVSQFVAIGLRPLSLYQPLAFGKPPYLEHHYLQGLLADGGRWCPKFQEETI